MDNGAIFEFNRNRFVGAFHEESVQTCQLLVAEYGVVIGLRREFRDWSLLQMVQCLPDELHGADLRLQRAVYESSVGVGECQRIAGSLQLDSVSQKPPSWDVQRVCVLYKQSVGSNCASTHASRKKLWQTQA